MNPVPFAVHKNAVHNSHFVSVEIMTHMRENILISVLLGLIVCALNPSTATLWVGLTPKSFILPTCAYSPRQTSRPIKKYQ